MIDRRTWGLGATLALLPFATVTSQEVVVSEVHFAAAGAGSGDGDWIEVANLGTSTADLDGWSLFVATPVGLLPGQYFWAFPPDTELPAGERLRVHWFTSWRAGDPQNVYTGTHVLSFLFGLGGAPLDDQAGAVALLSSIENTRMIDPTVYHDWVTWGAPDANREQFAVTNGRWTAGEFAVAGAPGLSLALIEDRHAEPTRPSAFFRDASPTPNTPNAGGASATVLGHPCAVGSVDPPVLELATPAIAGSIDFSITVRGGDPWGGLDVILLFGRPNAVGQRWLAPRVLCPLYLDTSGFAAFATRAPAGTLRTDFPLVVPELPTGSVVGAQALLLRRPGVQWDHAASAALRITIGG